MPANFAPNSRYAATDTLTMAGPDGVETAYLAPRILPHPENLAQTGTYGVADGDRIDNVAAATLGDPLLWWRLADANRAMCPRDLTAVPGTVLRICLPEGVQGAPHV
ncbi:MAG: LysM domain-containing protein [Specibacter sp.]